MGSIHLDDGFLFCCAGQQMCRHDAIMRMMPDFGLWAEENLSINVKLESCILYKLFYVVSVAVNECFYDIFLFY